MFFLLFVASEYFYCVQYPDCQAHQVQDIFECRAALLFYLVFKHFLFLIGFRWMSFHSILGTQIIDHFFYHLCLLLFLLYLMSWLLVNLSLLRLHLDFFIFLFLWCFILFLIGTLFFLNCMLLLFYFFFILFCWLGFMMIEECFRSIIEVVQQTIQDILWIQAIYPLDTISMLINYDDSWICSHLKMSETEFSPIAVAIELVKFKIGANFMAAFKIIDESLNKAAVLAPGGEKLYHFECIRFFYCREY